jgi:GNAT superfamily N-acetyltransferase
VVFASTELARRVEATERDLVEACVEAVARRTGADRVFARRIAGGLATCVGRESPLNKVAGLGFGGMPAEEELAAVETQFAARGAPVQVELCALAESGIAERLTRRGYALVGFENVLGRRLTAAETFETRGDVTVERNAGSGGGRELDGWIDVVARAFATPDAQGLASHESYPREEIERVMRDLAGARGLVRYLARREGEPAGGASLRTNGGIALLCGAGTLPAHRRRGVQRALLERRLADAASAGCELAVVTTLPGSKSQENVQRHGFELLYTRAILRRDSC